MQLRVFISFFFKHSQCMFLLHYTCSVLRSRNSRKAFKFLSKCLVLLLYGNQYRNLCFVHKTTYLWSMSSPGGGNCLFLRARGWGIDRQVRKKWQIPGVCPGGGWLQVELNHALLVMKICTRDTSLRKHAVVVQQQIV